MKRIMIVPLFLLVYFLTSLPVSAVEMVDEETAIWLRDHYESIFPIRVAENEFNYSTDKYYYRPRSSAGSDIQVGDGFWKINIYGNSDPMNSYNSRSMILSGSSRNFFLSVDVEAKDIYPADKAACAISYTNRLNTDVRTESSLTLYIGDRYRVEKSSPDAVATVEFNETAETNRINKKTKIIIMRIFGYTLFFADDVFLGQAMDDFEDPMILAFDAVLFPEGESASCKFDNLMVRKMISGNPIGKTDEELRLERER